MELNFKTFGQGEPVIILHGLFGTLDNWQTIGRKLAEQYTVYLIDQRNHGRSPHADTISYEAMADDLRHFMEEHWIYEAFVIGHSMGGKTAMQFALSNPDMVNKLVVVDIAPRAYQGGHHEIFQALFSLDLSSLNSRNEADEQLKERIEDYGVRQFLLKNLTRNKGGGFNWKMNLPVLFEDYENILSAIENEEEYTGPTLFVKGSNSRYIQQTDVEDIQRLFPQSQIETINNAGHWIHAEAPTPFFATVSQFLQ